MRSDKPATRSNVATVQVRQARKFLQRIVSKNFETRAHYVADDDAALARKSATKMCKIRRTALTVPKIDGGVCDDYVPSSSEVDEALTARKALKALFRNGDARLDHLRKKCLSSFSFDPPASGYDKRKMDTLHTTRVKQFGRRAARRAVQISRPFFLRVCGGNEIVCAIPRTGSAVAPLTS
jgi:hypothetical protein